jgi:hypothetical protein
MQSQYPQHTLTMPATAFPLRPSCASPTSIREKVFNIFVSPTDVLDEVIASSPNLANWRVPTLLVCLVSIISLQLGSSPGQSAATIHNLAVVGAISAAQSQALAGAWPLLSAALVCMATFVGTCWSAFVLWFIGRTFLKVRFPYLKALEIVGVTEIISVLGSVMTILLIGATGDPTAQPALSMLASNLNPRGTLHQILETLNVFHLWSTVVLAIGLSRLCNITFKEAAFWVFGYWMVARMVLFILQ